MGLECVSSDGLVIGPECILACTSGRVSGTSMIHDQE